MINVWLTIRSVLIQSLQHLLIELEDHDVRPNPEFIAPSVMKSGAALNSIYLDIKNPYIRIYHHTL